MWHKLKDSSGTGATPRAMNATSEHGTWNPSKARGTPLPAWRKPPTDMEGSQTEHQKPADRKPTLSDVTSRTPVSEPVPGLGTKWHGGHSQRGGSHFRRDGIRQWWDKVKRTDTANRTRPDFRKVDRTRKTPTTSHYSGRMIRGRNRCRTLRQRSTSSPVHGQMPPATW